MYCTKCGHDNDNEAQFCTNCGSALQVVRRRPIGLIGKVKGFILSPITTFEAVKDDTLRNALIYAFICFAICGALSGLITSVFLGAANFFLPDWIDDLGFVLTPITAVIFGVSGIIIILIAGLWQQLWVYSLGGRKGYTQTVKAISYGATPSFLLGWIPYIGVFVGSVWAIFISVIGLKTLHEISTGRAVASCLLAIVSLYFLFFALLLLALLLAEII